MGENNIFISFFWSVGFLGGFVVLLVFCCLVGWLVLVGFFCLFLFVFCLCVFLFFFLNIHTFVYKKI